MHKDEIAPVILIKNAKWEWYKGGTST